MKKTHRNIIIIFIATLLVLSGGLFFLGKHFALKPKRFRAFLEYALHNLIDEPVSIGDARLRFKDGILVTIKDFRMGRPEAMHMDVDKLEALFAPFKLLAGGSHALSLRFTQPEMTLYIEPLMEEGSTNLSVLSSAEIENGSINVFYRGSAYLLRQINGKISPTAITLSTHTLDGQASIYARKVNGKWTGKTEAGNLALDKLECGISGNVDITAGIEEQDNGLNVSLLISAKNIDLPGSGKIIPRAGLMMDFGGSGDHIQFREIQIKTDALNLSGIGNLDLARGENLGDAFLNIKLGSNNTDYEALVEYIPPDLCPDWLNLLLFKQVRDGNLEISLLEYNGALKTFNDSFYNNLYIKASLNGLSYGAGHNDDRITEATATALFEKGNLSFKNISGRAGNSTITSVDLILPDIAEDGLRLIVNADLDVNAKDFAKIWRAAMEPKEVFDLMAPLSNVTSGSIKAKVSYKDGFEGIPPNLMGAIHLDDCSFLWSDFKLENISGSASADEFGLPFAINMSGKFNSLPISSLTVNLSDLLGQQVYDYTLITNGPNFDGFRLSKESSITIKGKGKGPDFKGDMAIFIKGFTLGDKKYIPAGNRINGSGKITGTLWPESKLNMTDIKLPMGSAGLNLEMILKKIGGSINMSGTINARQKGSPPGALNGRSLMGGIEMILVWGEGLPASGSIKLDDMSAFINDKMLVVNGPITISGPLLSSKRLDITHGIDTTIKLSGRLELKDRNNHFTGDISVDGFKMNPKESSESSSLQLPESFTGEANIQISNLNFMGFPFEKASMKAKLNEDKLFLGSINCGGEYGTLSGGAEFSKKKGNRFIVDIDLKNEGLEDFFSTLYSNKFLIDGYLRLKGRIHGTTESINGKLVFSARDGHILKSSFMTRLFGALNFYKIIKSRDLNLGEKRLSYNKIFSSFDIKDNVMTFDDFYLDSNSIQLSAIGNYNIETKIIDSTIGVQPLETLDKAVSVIPVIGWVLTGEGKKLIVISFTATGDISKPEIDLAPTSGLSQQASDTLIRILDLPERLIDKSGNMLRKSKK